MASNFTVTVIGALIGGVIGAIGYNAFREGEGLSLTHIGTVTKSDLEDLKTEIKGEMDRLVPEFLKKHPEVIPQTMQAAMMAEQQKQQEAAQKAVAENQTKIFDASRPHVGQGKVPMAVFFDYNCGYCRKADVEMAKVLGKGEVTAYYIDLPILSPVSEKAAKAALAAHKQGKYKELHDKFMNSQERLSDEIIMAALQEVGLDPVQAKADMEGPEVANQIKQNMELAQTLNLSATPALIIGQQLIPGFAPAEALEVLIAQEGGSSDAVGAPAEVVSSGAGVPAEVVSTEAVLPAEPAPSPVEEKFSSQTAA